MITTHDGLSIWDFHNDDDESDHPLLEIIALELTLIRLELAQLNEDKNG